MSQREQLAFVGLGIMGLPMAENLLKAGHPVIVYNRTPGKTQELAARGAVAVTSLPDLAARAEVIFLCVGDSAAVSEVCASLLETIRHGSLVVDCSTISPAVSREIAQKFQERGADFLDAPCTGSKVGATNATLTFMVGGVRKAFARAKPYLAAMGQHIFHVGAQGMGLQVKLSQNLIGALTTQAMAEGFVLAKKAGISPSVFLEVLQASVARNALIEGKMKLVLARRFEPAHFSLKWMHKDMTLMLESARELQVPLPATALVHELFGASIAAGHGDEDFAAAITLLEGLAGVEVTDPSPSQDPK